MEKGDARQFQPMFEWHDDGWNIVELESQRQLRQKIHELIHLSNNTAMTTSEIRQLLHHTASQYGHRLTTHLVRSLQQEDQEERQAVVWLLTVLDDKEAIPLLLALARNKHFPRTIRLSASLALAGMNATRELKDLRRNTHFFAIS